MSERQADLRKINALVHHGSRQQFGMPSLSGAYGW
jgi:hypothetical protein